MIEKLQSLFGFFPRIEMFRNILNGCPDQNARLAATDRETLRAFAREWRELFHNHGFDNQEERTRAFLTNRPFTYSEAVMHLAELERSFRGAIEARFVYVLKEDGYNYTSPSGFGEAVERSFPSAQLEIDTARMCFALGQPTACVFHLMRSVEHLLRVFVVAVGVRQRVAVPLEYEVWDRLIRMAEEKISSASGASGSLDTWKSRATKEAAKSTLRASISDFYSFKDNVRNVLMHTRSGFLDEPTAMGIMDRVQRCFERLAPYLSEGKKRSLLVESRWSKAGTGRGESD